MGIDPTPEQIEQRKKSAVQSSRKWKKKNPDAAKRHTMAFKERNPDYAKQWADKNRAYLNARGAEWRAANPDKAKESCRKWRVKNKAARATYMREKRRTCWFTKISGRVRSRLNEALRAVMARKTSSTTILLGCSILELKSHLESLFREGMAWDNHGKWHIDHIIPCSSFNLVDPAEQYKCFHYTNLQPLWAHDNLSKGGPRRIAKSLTQPPNQLP
jgi:hypothetical protein